MTAMIGLRRRNLLRNKTKLRKTTCRQFSERVDSFDIRRKAVDFHHAPEPLHGFRHQRCEIIRQGLSHTHCAIAESMADQGGNYFFLSPAFSARFLRSATVALNAPCSVMRAVTNLAGVTSKPSLRAFVPSGQMRTSSRLPLERKPLI